MQSVVLSVSDLRTALDLEAGTAHAVDGVSFELAEGETLALVGESGCGKSMTALSLLRLVPSPPGRIVEGSSVRLRGEELTRVAEARMREIRGNEIAMIFQEPMTSLNPVFTVGEQVGEALRLHRGLHGRELRSEVVRLLDRVGIPEPARRAGDYPHQLSGGMRQRVMIAMALSCEPAVLVADEPTTALDVTVQAQILELLLELQRETGMAILLITHDLGVVAETADRVAVMYAGQIVETASAGAFFRRPLHPYAEGLLRAVPDLDAPPGRLAVIPGVVPSPLDFPVACRFHPRCPYAWERCRTASPALLAEEPERRARCWLLEEPSRRLGGFSMQAGPS